jgi:hypothetical protein
MRNGPSDTYWRYQPVYQEQEDGRLYTIVEVYIKDGKLNSWTEGVRPAGNTFEELMADIRKYQEDCQKYAPIDFDTLEAGMVL